MANYDGNFRVSTELRPNGEQWFWVIGHNFGFPARDENDAHRILEEKKNQECFYTIEKELQKA